MANNKYLNISNLFLLSVLILLIVGTQTQECGRNQEFNNCGSACPPKCVDEPRKICTLQCIVGCQCKRGYVLNANSECVTPAEC